MTLLFRAMQADAVGLPSVGAHARCLGVRPGIDVPAILPGDTVKPGQGGLSVSPHDPMNLPYFRRPPEFQGNGKDPVWACDDSQLGPDLVYRPDPSRSGHGFIEPAHPMTLDDFQQELTRTQAIWAIVTSSP
jgi:hypothetical protein